MKIRITFLIMACAIFAIGCVKNVGPDPVPDDIVLTQKSASLVKSGNLFTFNLLKKIPASEDQNMMVSPLSISLAFSMVLNGADGETKNAIVNSLGLEGLSVDEINQIYLDLITALEKADPNVVMNIANSIWIRKGYPVLEPFISTNKKYFDARIAALDFDQSTLAIINGWVNEKTNTKIPKILDQISADEIMFLINAIYFNGKWSVKFEKGNTENGSFSLVSGSSVSVPLMKIKDDYGYSEQAGYKALKLPYGRGKFNMVLLLPDEGKSVDQLIDQLTPTTWDVIKKALVGTSKVDVWIPRLKFSWESELNDILSSMGMAVAFSKTEANFSKINSTDQLFITKVKHKTFIEVNEEGTEAAGVTSIGIGVTSIGPGGPQFHATRPFVFFITEEDTGAILFAGKVINPLLTN